MTREFGVSLSSIEGNFSFWVPLVSMKILHDANENKIVLIVWEQFLDFDCNVH